MAEEGATAHTESVPGIPAPLQKLPTDVMQVSDTMILLTWIVFGVAAFCLHKLLWKPILKALASREQSIAEALDGADKARKELAQTETRSREIIDRANEESRSTAERAAREAEATVGRADLEAKRVAQRRVEEAERVVAAEQRKAMEAVRLDAAKHIGETLETLLRQKMTDEQKHAYQAAMLGEVKV